MHFTSIILATGLAASASGAVLPALFGARQESALSFQPAGTGFPSGLAAMPTSIGSPKAVGTGNSLPSGGPPVPTGLSLTMGTSVSPPFPSGTGLPLPIGTGSPQSLPSNSNLLQNAAVKAKSDTESSAATATKRGSQTKTRGTYPTGTNVGSGFASPSGSAGFGAGRPQASGGAGSGFGGSGNGSGRGSSPTGSTRITGPSGARQTGSTHSRNVIPAARRGWFF